jgi:hypothetical protein
MDRRSRRIKELCYKLNKKPKEAYWKKVNIRVETPENSRK